MPERTHMATSTTGWKRYLKRAAQSVGVAIFAFAIWFLYIGWGRLPDVWARDRVYSQLSVGDPVKRVEELLGRPDAVDTWPNGGDRYIYSIARPYWRNHRNPPNVVTVQWTIEIDDHGNVASLSRSEYDPC